MAEQSDLEKTEPASPRRLEKAREEGQVARSRELNTFALLLTGVAALWLMGSMLYHTLAGLIRAHTLFDPRIVRDEDQMVMSAAHSAAQALLTLLPLFGILIVMAILSSVLLGGLVFTGKSMAPKFERLNPLKGIARLFSAQSLVELFKTVIKAIVVGGISVLVITQYIEPMIALMYATPEAALTTGIRLVALCSALIVAGLILIVIIDAPWQIFSHQKKLRMSQQDLKQEHKETEGDPHVKSRIRQQQRSMAQRRMMSQVPKADVVITNPTHFAVALIYGEGATGAYGGAPVVVAKGAGEIALRIRALAQENAVTVFEAPTLARALYFHVEIEQEIPANLYAAVAQVLAWVYQLKAWHEGTGVAPVQAPTDLPVPAGMAQRAWRAGANT